MPFESLVGEGSFLPKTWVFYFGFVCYKFIVLIFSFIFNWGWGCMLQDCCSDFFLPLTGFGFRCHGYVVLIWYFVFTWGCMLLGYCSFVFVCIITICSYLVFVWMNCCYSYLFFCINYLDLFLFACYGYVVWYFFIFKSYMLHIYYSDFFLLYSLGVACQWFVFLVFVCMIRTSCYLVLFASCSSLALFSYFRISCSFVPIFPSLFFPLNLHFEFSIQISIMIVFIFS